MINIQGSPKKLLILFKKIIIIVWPKFNIIYSLLNLNSWLCAVILHCNQNHYFKYIALKYGGG